MKENFSKASKLGGIIASLCLIVLGGMIFFFPVGSLVITTWLFTAGVGRHLWSVPHPGVCEDTRRDAQRLAEIYFLAV